MDGCKKRLNDSIRLRLSFSLSAVILVAAVVAGIFSFVSAFDEANELQDDTLRQIASLLARQKSVAAYAGEAVSSRGGDEEFHLVVQYLGDAQKTTATSGSPLPIPATLPDGLHTLAAGNEPFRVLVRTTAGGQRIAVAQAARIRDEIARESALRTVMPFLILIPVLILIVADLVRKMFRPIDVLSAEIDRRAEQALHPVEWGHLPVEVRPFVVAINRLLGRVAKSMEVQRRFVADAAHELRTPLTAISLQAERLAESEMSDPTRERLKSLMRGIERSRHLVDQLLSLAKSQDISELAVPPLSVRSIYLRVLEDLMPLADARHIDIGIEGDQDAQVSVSELDMIAMVRNLVDNAIRYTPEGGRIDMSIAVEQGRVVLQIQDDGPGIPLSERERIFDPFYRILGSNQTGSGLGMSIVKTIADRAGAEICMDFADEENGSGLRVRVAIPLSDGCPESFGNP